jgi:Ni,Fe-hydrogenase I cytochrome b subunit
MSVILPYMFLQLNATAYGCATPLTHARYIALYVFIVTAIATAYGCANPH